MSDRDKNQLSLPMVAAITGIILAGGVGTAWWAKSNLGRQPQVSQPNPAPLTEDKFPPFPQAITEERVVEICWLNPTGENIQLVSRTMTFEKSIKPERVLETALEALLEQPPGGSNFTTAIPKGTKLLSLKTDKTGIYLNLSREFVSGGGSASMSSRLAQVIFTATSAYEGNLGGASERPVWLNVEGKPLENLGEEGIIVNQPMTRDDFKYNFEGFNLGKSTS